MATVAANDSDSRRGETPSVARRRASSIAWRLTVKAPVRHRRVSAPTRAQVGGRACSPGASPRPVLYRIRSDDEPGSAGFKIVSAATRDSMSGQIRRLLTFLFERKRQPGAPPNDRQRMLVEKKFELLRQASFEFTDDRLLHLQGSEFGDWNEACTSELRRKIISAAPPHVEIILIGFPSLRCISLQCRALVSPGRPGG